ncbi:antitoxin [Streptomyces sp. NPDC052396]|uniref:antitoxin n=1 Tax=Streptomyces sp. NPDC052396 TaxID=3365689 RepID=UPI0037D12E43
MGLFDDLKAKLEPVKGKVGDLVQQHGARIEQGIDKAAQAVDARTDGKYTSQIRTGTGKAKQALDRLGEQDGRGGRA